MRSNFPDALLVGLVGIAALGLLALFVSCASLDGVGPEPVTMESSVAAEIQPGTLAELSAVQLVGVDDQGNSVYEVFDAHPMAVRDIASMLGVCEGDVNADGQVDLADLNIVLGRMGEICD